MVGGMIAVVDGFMDDDGPADMGLLDMPCGNC